MLSIAYAETTPPVLTSLKQNVIYLAYTKVYFTVKNCDLPFPPLLPIKKYMHALFFFISSQLGIHATDSNPSDY